MGGRGGRRGGDRKCTSALYVSAQVRPVQLKILVREVCLRGHVRAAAREKEGDRREMRERGKVGKKEAERVGGKPRAVAIYVNIFLMVSSETFCDAAGKNMKH